MRRVSVFFTSDTHFGHYNIIKYCNRPWKTTEEMNEGLIERWNSVVRPSDDVYHLGDFCMGGREPREFTRYLNGRIHLIRGNHDKHVYDQGFVDVVPYKELKLNRKHIVLCHFPFRSWNRQHHGAWHLFGHVHGAMKFDDLLCLDVGVDAVDSDYRPLSLDQVFEIMSKKKWIPPEDKRGGSL